MLARDRLAVAYLKATPLTAAFAFALLSGTTTIIYQLTDLEFIEMLQRKLWAGLEEAQGDRLGVHVRRASLFVKSRSNYSIQSGYACRYVRPIVWGH